MRCVLAFRCSEMIQGVPLVDSEPTRRLDPMSSQIIESVRVLIFIICFLVYFAAIVLCFVEFFSKSPYIFPVEEDTLGVSIDPNNMSVYMFMDHLGPTYWYFTLASMCALLGSLTQTHSKTCRASKGGSACWYFTGDSASVIFQQQPSSNSTSRPNKP